MCHTLPQSLIHSSRFFASLFWKHYNKNKKAKNALWTDQKQTNQKQVEYMSSMPCTLRRGQLLMIVCRYYLKTRGGVLPLTCFVKLRLTSLLLRNLMCKFICSLNVSQNAIIVLLSNSSYTFVWYQSALWKLWYDCLWDLLCVVCNVSPDVSKCGNNKSPCSSFSNSVDLPHF